MDKYLQADKELATLLGFKNITAVGEIALSGTKEVKRNLFYPMSIQRWCHDNAAAFDLMVDHDISIDLAFTGVRAGLPTISYSDHPDRNTAVRYAIVQAVIAKLKITNPYLGDPSD